MFGIMKPKCREDIHVMTLGQPAVCTVFLLQLQTSKIRLELGLAALSVSWCRFGVGVTTSFHAAVGFPFFCATLPIV